MADYGGIFGGGGSGSSGSGCLGVEAGMNRGNTKQKYNYLGEEGGFRPSEQIMREQASRSRQAEAERQGMLYGAPMRYNPGASRPGGPPPPPPQQGGPQMPPWMQGNSGIAGGMMMDPRYSNQNPNNQGGPYMNQPPYGQRPLF